MLMATWIITFFIIIGCGIIAGRRITSSNQWSGGDKTLSLWSVGAVLGAWQIGGMSIVGAAQNGYVIGISGAWYSIAGGLYFLVMAIFAKYIRNLMPGDSVPVYLTKRFSANSGRLYSYIWLALGLFYIPIQLKTVASLIQIVVPSFDANYAMVVGLIIAALYTSYAGMKGAAVIGKIVCIGIYVLLIGFVVITLPKFGGYSGLIEKLPPKFGSMGNMPTQRIVAWIFSGIISTIVMQSALQPVLAAKDAKAARWGAVLGYAIAGPICIITATVGMMGRATTDTLGNGATAFAWTLKEYNSPIIAGIVFAVATLIIAATLASMMMAQGTVLANVYRTQINPKADDKKVLRISKYGTFVFALVTLIPAFLIPSADLTRLFMILLNCATGPISFSLFAGLLWKRTTPAASFWSMLVGVIVGIVWVVTGMTAKAEPIYPIIAASYAVGFIVTFATSKKSALA